MQENSLFSLKTSLGSRKEQDTLILVESRSSYELCGLCVATGWSRNTFQLLAVVVNCALSARADCSQQASKLCTTFLFKGISYRIEIHRMNESSTILSLLIPSCNVTDVLFYCYCI